MDVEYARTAGSPRPTITVEMDRQNERIAQAMKLLLTARERVLSLSEQRVRLHMLLHTRLLKRSLASYSTNS